MKGQQSWEQRYPQHISELGQGAVEVVQYNWTIRNNHPKRLINHDTNQDDTMEAALDISFPAIE